MAESSAYARRGYSGAARPTTLVGAHASGATTITVADASTWTAADDNGPFRFTITDGTTEEEIEATAVSGNSFTGCTRGVGGTSAVSWSGGETVEHTSSARDFDEANRLVNAILGISSLTAGDLLYVLTSTTFARLAKGTARQQLAMNSGATAPEWVASLQSLLTAQGDIVYASAANTPARLAKGTALQALIMNSGATAPEWGASLASLLTTKGDLSTASAANTPARLAAGSDFQHLRARAGAANGIEYAALLSAATVTTSESTTSTSFTDLATPGPAVTVTTGTTALVILTANLYNNGTSQDADMGFAVSGASTVAAAGSASLEATTGASGAVVRYTASAVFPVTGLTAGSNTFTAKYKATGGTSFFANRSIVVIPT